MSKAYLYVLNKKSVTCVDEYGNARGVGPVLWDYMSEVHGIKTSKVCDLLTWDSVPSDEKAALLLTMDYTYVQLGSLLIAGTWLLHVGHKVDQHTGGRYVNHWIDIGEEMIRLAGSSFHPAAQGVCIGMSVADLWEEGNGKGYPALYPIMER